MDDHAGRLAFWEHVGILRTGILWCVALFIFAVVAIFSYAGDIVIGPLVAEAPGGLVFLSPLGPFLFKLKIAFLGATAVSLPLWLILLARFVGAALPKEKRAFLYALLAASLALGIAAAAAAYFYLIPVSIHVLSGFAVPGTSLMLTAESYLSFVLLQLLVAFVVVELPVAIIGLAYLRLLDPRKVPGQWRLVFVALLIALAVLTPTTDVFTLLLVVIPAFVLCVAALAVARMVYTSGTNK